MKAAYLFRGKIKGSHTGEYSLDWAFGNLVVEIKTDKHFIMDLSHYNENTKIKDTMLEVIPETVGKCTGIKDDTGCFFYEGDVFTSLISKVICKINIGYYDDKMSSQHGIIGVWFDVIGEKKPFGFDKAVLTKDTKNLKIIGNIYDNPEYIKKYDEVKE